KFSQERPCLLTYLLMTTAPALSLLARHFRLLSPGTPISHNMPGTESGRTNIFRSHQFALRVFGKFCIWAHQCAVMYDLADGD
ncbi:MAG TPA: hypothetical protein VFP47_17055, partial [Pyrinomonadaceae bacterium]|nr:hypothetical protein [Pyrinomonadaceae bacterium]